MHISLNSQMVIKANGLNVDVREIYKALTAYFPGETPMLVRRVVNGNKLVWNIPVGPGEEWRQFGTASPAEKAAVRTEINRYRERINERFHLPADSLDALFTTPDDDRFIFFCRKGDQVRVAIAGWGLQYKSASIDREKAPVLLVDGTAKLHRKVSVGFTHDGELLPRIDFELLLPTGFTKKFTTSGSGLCELGELNIDLTFTINVPAFGQSFSFVVTADKDKYLFEYQEPKPQEPPKPKKPAPETPKNPQNPGPSGGDGDKNKSGKRPVWNPGKPYPKKTPGRKVRKAPKPFIPNPGDIIYDPDRRSRVYGNCIFAIIDVQKSKSRTPLADFCKQFEEKFPGAAVVSRDDFCNMVTMVVHPEERTRILRELPSRISDVEFYADSVDVFGECGRIHEPFTTGGVTPATAGECAVKIGFDKDAMWHLDAIGAPAAHKMTTGNRSVRVAVIDSYFDLKHPAFAKLKVVSPLSLEDGTDAVLPPTPEDSHGTHVLGLIGARQDQWTGVAPGCTFIPISLGKNINAVSIIQGILYALANGATVINLSLGIDLPEEVLKKLTISDQVAWWREHAHGHENVWKYIYGMLDRGYCTAVWAAGNENIFELMDVQKRSDSIIRVDAVDSNLRKADFSNFGNIEGHGMDIHKSIVSAPGACVMSTLPGGVWDFKSGTSMSSPIVAGAVALMKSLDSTLLNEDIIRIVHESAQPVADREIGPLLRVDRALEVVSGSVSKWDDFVRNPASGLGLWKKIDQTTYVDTETYEFMYYGQNYLIFNSREGGVLEVHQIGIDLVYNAHFTTRWGHNEVWLDLIDEVKSPREDGRIMTRQMRLYKDGEGNVAFEVTLPELTSFSKIRKLDRDDRVNKNKRKL